MSLLIILPRERALLATRRLDDTADNKTVMHALDSDVFAYCCSHTDWASGIIGQHSILSYYRIASALTEDIHQFALMRLLTLKPSFQYVHPYGNIEHTNNVHSLLF